MTVYRQLALAVDECGAKNYCVKTVAACFAAKRRLRKAIGMMKIVFEP